METPFQNNSIFFVDVQKIKPNPFQPRIEFDNEQLESLSESIRMYGVLQPLVVTRKEVFTEEGGMEVQYELIAGERRLRASKLAGMKEVPVVIRSQEQTDQEKLELAIIENLQREDLNPVDRAKAFKQLADQFNLKHAEIGKRVGKSREYVSNSLRLLALPEDMLAALTVKKISEGHARSLLTLGDRPEEQQTLFKEIVLKGLTVRQAEKIARRVAFDKVRKKGRVIDPHTVEVEDEMSEVLGTRVHIERKAVGGKIEIDFFSEDDLAKILEVLKQHENDLSGGEKNPQAKMDAFIEQSGGLQAATGMILDKEKAIAEEKKTTVNELIGQEEVANEVVSFDQKETQEEEVEEFNSEPQKSNSSFSYASVLARANTQKEPEQEDAVQTQQTEKQGEEVQKDPFDQNQSTAFAGTEDEGNFEGSGVQFTPEDSVEKVSFQPGEPSVRNLVEEKKDSVEMGSENLYNSPQGMQDSFDSPSISQDLPGEAYADQMPTFKPVVDEDPEVQHLSSPMNLVQENQTTQKENNSYSSQEASSYPEQNSLSNNSVHVLNEETTVQPQVQTVLEQAQQPIPEGQSVSNLAEGRAMNQSAGDELYAHLTPQGQQQPKIDTSLEIGMPHYGAENQNNTSGSSDENLYRV